MGTSAAAAKGETLRIAVSEKIALRSTNLKLMLKNFTLKSLESLLQQKIKKNKKKIESEIWANIPNAFWHRKKNNVIQFPY
jgi:hypothetical protein